MNDKNDNKNAAQDVEGELGRRIAEVLTDFAAGGKFGPVEDPEEYERLTAALLPPERELNREVTNFMRLVDYLGQRNIKVTSDVADAMFAAARLPVPERIKRVREINQNLMTMVGNDCQGAQLRV